MERNSERTRKKIIEAVGRLLARSGAREVGVNAVAREAGVDKVLIYRYFGGLDDLLSAYAKEGDFWPAAEDLLAAVPNREKISEAELAANLLIQFGRALRRRPVTQEIMRWELLEKNELTDALARYREEQALTLLQQFRELGDADVQAISAVIGAGLTYLILRAKTAADYNGLDLRKERDWKRIENAIKLVIERIADRERS
jgi:AcrR family transcriptional regulator